LERGAAAVEHAAEWGAAKYAAVRHAAKHVVVRRAADEYHTTSPRVLG
jgi:hypothetical protein